MKTILDKAAIIKLKKEGFSSRKIEKLTGISRNTINKIWKNYQDDLNSITAKDVKSNIHELTDRIVKGSSYDSSNRGPRKYNLEIETALRKILDDEEKKTQRLGKNHKQKLTEKQIYELIVSQGFDIGKTTVCNRIKEIRDEIKETFIKQDYEYCDRFEYDFGEVKLFIAGECIKGYLAVMTSPASHFRWAYLYTNMKMEVFIDSHARFFELVGGSFKEGVYDNCRCVVSKFIGRNMKELNPELIKLSLYYDYQINVTNCFSGNEKGSVESAVKWIRNKVFASKYEFESFEEAENYLQNRLIEINKNSDIEEEKKYLKPYRPMYGVLYPFFFYNFHTSSQCFAVIINSLSRSETLRNLYLKTISIVVCISIAIPYSSVRHRCTLTISLHCNMIFDVWVFFPFKLPI